MRLPVLAAVPLVVVAVAAPALAAWVVAGTGTTAVAATSLAPPAAPAATPVAPTSSAIDVTWTDPLNPVGTTFQVVRDRTALGGPGPVTLACTTSPCHDTGLSPGTVYSYTVTAVLGAWSSGAATASATTTGALEISGAVLSKPGRVRLSGTGAQAGTAVQVMLCLGQVQECTATTVGYLETVSAMPTAAGDWGTAPTATRLLPGLSYTATARQGAAVSAPYHLIG